MEQENTPHSGRVMVTFETRDYERLVAMSERERTPISIIVRRMAGHRLDELEAAPEGGE